MSNFKQLQEDLQKFSKNQKSEKNQQLAKSNPVIDLIVALVDFVLVAVSQLIDDPDNQIP